MGVGARFEVADLFLYATEAPVNVAISMGALHHTNDCHAAIRRVCSKFVRPGGHAAGKVRREEIVTLMERDLAVWHALADVVGAGLTFVLQPMLNWTGKKESTEEAGLFSYLDGLPQNHFKLLRRIFDQESYGWLRAGLERTCSANRISFRDVNALLRPIMRDDQWLFVDRAHLTDLGNRLIAEAMIKEGCVG